MPDSTRLLAVVEDLPDELLTRFTVALTEQADGFRAAGDRGVANVLDALSAFLFSVLDDREQAQRRDL